MTSEGTVGTNNTEVSNVWENFHFRDVDMQFLTSGGLKQAVGLAIAQGAKSVAIVAKERYLEHLGSVTSNLCIGDSRNGGCVITTFSTIVQHVPNEVAERARSFARDNSVDGIIVIGGGSAIGTAKVMALVLSERVAFIAVPTTFSGSEMTPIYGITTDNRKVTTRDERVRPGAVIYDNSLLQSLPPSIALPSIANAFAHAAEALWVPTKSKTSTLLARCAIESISKGLQIMTDRPPSDGEPFLSEAALSDLSYGAALAGIAFGSTGSGIHHKICHLVGGTYGLDHANTHMIVGLELLPAMAQVHANVDHERIKMGVKAIATLIARHHLPKTLSSIGLDPWKRDLLLNEVGEVAKGIEPTLDQDQIATLFTQVIGY